MIRCLYLVLAVFVLGISEADARCFNMGIEEPGQKMQLLLDNIEKHLESWAKYGCTEEDDKYAHLQVNFSFPGNPRFTIGVTEYSYHELPVSSIGGDGSYWEYEGDCYIGEFQLPDDEKAIVELGKVIASKIQKVEACKKDYGPEEFPEE